MASFARMKSSLEISNSESLFSGSRWTNIFEKIDKLHFAFGKIYLAIWTNTSSLFCQDGEQAGDIQFRKLLSESRWTGELCQKVTSSKSLALKADEVIFLTRVAHFITRSKFVGISLLNISLHKLGPVSLFTEHISMRYIEIHERKILSQNLSSKWFVREWSICNKPESCQNFETNLLPQEYLCRYVRYCLQQHDFFMKSIK